MAPRNQPSTPQTAPAPLAIVQLADLRILLTEICDELMQDQRPALLDRAGLAKELSISVSKLDELRKEPGFPVIELGEASPRYEIQPVLAWLRARHGGGTR